MWICMQAKLLFPEIGLVYDYMLDDGGLSQGDSGGGDEDEDETRAEVTTNHILTINQPIKYL